MSTIDPSFVGPPPRLVRGLSWGALVFPPLWLLRNGFWFSALLYVVLVLYFWPLSLVLVVLFFIFGARWSWAEGQRWRSYEQFLDSRFAWDFSAFVMLSALGVIVSLELSIATGLLKV